MLVVLGATLTTLNSFASNVETNVRQTDSQDEARRAVDRLARDLRNLASPTDEQPLAIRRAEPQDLIVQSVGDVRPVGSLNQRNTQYVRYCYDATARRVVRQRLTWTTKQAPAVPSGTRCSVAGGGGWETTDAAAQDVVNDARPLFTYNESDPFRITEIHSALHGRPRGNQGPDPTRPHANRLPRSRPQHTGP